MDAPLTILKEIYCTTEKNEYLLKLNTEITKTIITEIDLNVPQVIEASEDEFRSAFWEYLDNLV